MSNKHEEKLIAHVGSFLEKVVRMDDEATKRRTIEDLLEKMRIGGLKYGKESFQASIDNMDVQAIAKHANEELQDFIIYMACLEFALAQKKEECSIQLPMIFTAFRATHYALDLVSPISDASYFHVRAFDYHDTSMYGVICGEKLN